MASLDSEAVKRALLTKMKCSEEKGHDHIRYVLRDGNKILSRTMISHGSRHTIRDPLIHKMARQIQLGTNANFVDMVSCKKSREECLEIIRAATR
jgi:hypothetical protein